MSTIDDIWDVPVDATPKRNNRLTSVSNANTPARPSPSKRRRTTLFLSSDSENEEPATRNMPYKARSPQPQQNNDKTSATIDALFDDLDDDVDGGFKELAPSLNVEQLRKSAEAKHRTKAPALTPHQILPSSSPPRDLGPEEDEAGPAKEGGKGKKSGGLHKRKAIPKLDEARLLDKDGFPALVRQTKEFIPRGKGHEASDLNRLMQIYQFWTHKMYPKMPFNDTVQRVERLCHSKRMHNALGRWRDEAKGTIHGLRPEELDPLGDSSDSSAGSDGETETVPAIAVPAATRSSSPPTRPPSSGSEHTSLAQANDDDFDIDAMIREDEERQTANPAVAPPAPLQPAIDDEDQDMWDQFDIDDTLVPSVPVSRPPVAPLADDDDEEMWDIMREMETEKPTTTAAPTAAVAAVPPPAAPDVAPMPNSIPPVPDANAAAPQPQEELGATNDEGWDDMYL